MDYADFGINGFLSLSSFQIIDILVPDTRGWLERYQENYMMKFE